MIEIRPAGDKGFGVFATGDIGRGEKIDFGKILPVPEGLMPDHTWEHEGRTVLTLAALTWCNHSDSPNCVSIAHGETDLLVSIKAIRAGEELTLCYFDFEDTP